MIVKILRKIRPAQLWRLLGFCLGNPLYAIPTMRATTRCMKVSEKKYGKAHHGDGPPNAFRHALWNVLIARYCARWRRGTARALLWTERITTWHESFSRNDPFSTAMDLHNNKVGRSYYSETTGLSEVEMIEWVAGKAAIARAVTSVSEIDQYPNELVFISAS